MTPKTEELQEVYTKLGQILQRPEVFGLGPVIPQPLADSLETMLGKLGQAMTKQDEGIPAGDLAAITKEP